MTNSTTSAAGLLTPEQVGTLLVEPTLSLAQAAKVARRVTLTAPKFRVPIIAKDAAASWVSEGDEIDVTDADVDELVVTPAKLGAVSVITSELAADTSPEATQEVGLGIARSLATSLDATFFGAQASPAPQGLGTLADVNVIDAGEKWDDLDAFTAAAMNAERLGAHVDSFVASPDDALALSQLKAYTTAGSNIPLLQPDPTQPTRRLIGGVPLLVSAGVTSGTVWAIPSDRALLVVREDADIVTDGSVYFTSDRVAVRGTMRVGFGFPQPPVISRITLHTTWAADTAYALNSLVVLSDGDTVLKATTAGTSDDTEPTAPDAVGDTVTDGTVTWTRTA